MPNPSHTQQPVADISLSLLHHKLSNVATSPVASRLCTRCPCWLVSFSSFAPLHEQLSCSRWHRSPLLWCDDGLLLDFFASVSALQLQARSHPPLDLQPHQPDVVFVVLFFFVGVLLKNTQNKNDVFCVFLVYC